MNPSPMHNISVYAKGVMGETAACDFLIARGLSPIQRRYHSPYGEIDLIMIDHEVLVFVEVKARERASTLSAQAAITPRKQRNLVNTARCYLSEHPEHGKRAVRFDVVTVTKDGIQHISNAFEGSEW